MMGFRDRRQAGQRLAEELRTSDLRDPVVLALPRGGVPVAFEVAVDMVAPLDVFVARKVGAPSSPETGIGAIAEGGVVVADRFVLQMMGISPEQFERLADHERRELARRVEHYRGDRRLPSLADRDVVIVDDGLATGVTAEAAVRAIQQHGARHTTLAVPVCAPDTADRLRGVADAVVCVISPTDFYAVGQWYSEFGPTSDGEVLELLELAAARTEVRQ
jgi:putative phosphoribosyl transferase